MNAFRQDLRQRLGEARLALAAAQRDGDDYGVQTHASEVEGLERLANAHRVDAVDASGTAVEGGTV